jgi:hypothetical protein
MIQVVVSLRFSVFSVPSVVKPLLIAPNGFNTENTEKAKKQNRRFQRVNLNSAANWETVSCSARVF